VGQLMKSMTFCAAWWMLSAARFLSFELVWIDTAAEPSLKRMILLTDFMLMALLEGLFYNLL